MSRDLLYENLIRPLLFKLDPESVHELAQSVMKSSQALLPALSLKYGAHDLTTDLFGQQLAHPLGLAAGFDKNASLVNLHGPMGFAFAEIGSVCARPHGGNTRPRMFRLPEDSALINRLGLNGLGAEVVAMRLSKFGKFPLPLGLNIAKTNDLRLTGQAAVEDLVYTFERVKDLPLSYVTINTSCPNTAEGCLKESGELASILERVSALNSAGLPILLKLSPDSKDDFITEIIRLSKQFKVSGFVCGNTTVSREGLASPQDRLTSIGNGGLSGKPLKRFNLELTRKIASLKTREQIIIGVGGIMNGMDAFEYLEAGARLLQIYTGFVYRGPSAVKQICTELSQILKERGLSLNQMESQRLSPTKDIPGLPSS